MLGAHDFIMFPGQTFEFYPNATWYVSTWSGECVVKLNPEPKKSDETSFKFHSHPKPQIVPFAYVVVADNEQCPVGEIFSPGKQFPWKPYNPKTSPRTLIFDTASKVPFCFGVSNEEAVKNTATLNDLLDSMNHGDRLIIAPGIHCMGAGVHGFRLEHNVIDLQGTLYFAQTTKEWPHSNTKDPKSVFIDAVLFSGVTNVTLTSSNRLGGLEAEGCLHWYTQRTFDNVNGGNKMLHFMYDNITTFASSQILVEYIQVQNGPFWQTFYEKVVNVEIHHVKVNVDCSPLKPNTVIKEALDSIAKETDGIDVWGTNVHIHNVEVSNFDDCICVKGSTDGSGIFSENWLVENSTARGYGLTIGSLFDGNFLVRNVTYRNIYMKDTNIGIYIKVDAGRGANIVKELRYENITIDGASLFPPVFVGPVHQFTGGDCNFYWPFLRPSTCEVTGTSTVNVTIDGLTIIRKTHNGFPGMHVSDFLFVSNERSPMNIFLSNINVVDIETKKCEDPPLSLDGTCGNACYEANVITDESISINCESISDMKRDGECAPLIGSVKQRCKSKFAKKDELCNSGLRCVQNTTNEFNARTLL